jgi:ATP-dependent helicase IRC3
LFENEKADFYREYDLNLYRKQKSNKPEAVHQIETINKLNKWFNSKKFPSGSIVALPTGSGKTFAAVRFLCKNVLGKDYKLLWLAHTHHLLEQAFYSFGPLSEKINEGYEVGWIPEPKECLNVRVVSGMQYHFDVNQIKSNDDVLIATLQSMLMLIIKIILSLMNF